MKTAHALAHASSPTRRNNVRVELFFSSALELRERISFLDSKGISSFNIVNKSNRDDISLSAQSIEEAFPEERRKEVNVCVHYSLKYNKSRKMNGAFHRLKEFAEGMGQLRGKNELLLVTGSGPKGRFNSLTALEQLQSESVDIAPSMAVAFNPFFPNEKDNEEEKARLMQKLETGIVSKVYLQFGTNLERLRSSLQLLTQARSTSPRRIDICGSIFLPTKKLIAQQKFRPWNGVFLSEDFLSSEDVARGLVLQMMRLYEEFGCEILIEAPGVRNAKDWMVVESLLAERDEFVAAEGSSGKVDDAKVRPADPEEKGHAMAKRRKKNQGTSKPLKKGSSMPDIVLRKPGIVLFGTHDLRVHDNVALEMGSHHEKVIPIFIWSRKEQGKWGVTGCLEVILKDALRSLEGKMKQNDLRLVCREGDDSSAVLRQICTECDAGAVYWNKEHTPEGRLREKNYRTVLKEMDIPCSESQCSLMYDPVDPFLSTGFHGGHWGTLMPFLKGCKKQLGEPRLPTPRSDTFYMLESMEGPDSWPESTAIGDLDIAVVNGEQRWDTPILKCFPMSEDAALKNMDLFLKKGFMKYERERSRADIEGATSKLSAHLRIGTLSPNVLYYKIEGSNLDYNERKTFSRRLFWRDLAYFQLHSFPEMRDTSIRPHYEDVEWCPKEEEEKRFSAWKKGQTGFPLVDGAMRELWHTGWMTQSLRMVVASFLVEYLRVDWVKGCEWFHYTLVDADSAINPMMWQNAGRSGIDQWNFVMSPIAASQDASGEYTRRWVPELSNLPNTVLHKPWEAPPQILQAAGVVLGETYPARIIKDLKTERARSVDAVLEMRRKNQQLNTDRGYDLIQLPGGKKTVVFTKKEFRVDRNGNVVKEPQRKKPKDGNGRRGAKGKAAQKKQLQLKAAVKK